MNEDRASNPTFAFNESAPEAGPAPRAAAGERRIVGR